MIFKRIGSAALITPVFVFFALTAQLCFAQSQYKITVIAREGGKIVAPDGSEVIGPSAGQYIFAQGSTPEFTFIPDASKHLSDIVLDSFSQVPDNPYVFTSLAANHEIIGVFSDGDAALTLPDTAGDDQVYTASVPPSVMLVMSRDQKLYHRAYSDYDDLDGDGTIDTTYNHSINYYGYFDPYVIYKYTDTGDPGKFYPVRNTYGTASEKLTSGNSGDGEWSGNFLNWTSMARIDLLRKVLYGGYRSTDTDSETVLERTFLPQDSHSWVKVYKPTGSDPAVNYLTPFNDTALSLCNTTLDTNNDEMLDSNDQPVIRISKGEWLKWASNDRWQCAVKGEKNTGLEDLRPDAADLLGAGNYVARVKVCDSTVSGTDKCREYPNGNLKPAGLLQTYGDSDRMLFGLMTGSYTNNKSGGVLRKNIGPITDEIDSNTGIFTNSQGIISTIDKLRIIGYQYSDGVRETGIYNSCTSTGPDFTTGTCNDWGNPLAEIYYEALRYFSGKGTPTPEFEANDSGIIQGLTPVTWNDPYSDANYCSKPYIITISDVSPGYDSDQLPGSAFSSFTGDITELDVTNETDFIGTNERLSGNYFAGLIGASYDSLCTAKDIAPNLGEVLGICPDEPDRMGSYYLAGLGYWAKTTDLRTDLADNNQEQNVDTYSIALDSPGPEIRLTVGNGEVTVIPICHNETYNNNATLVNFGILNTGSSGGTYYLNWDESRQGDDYDQDFDGYLHYSIEGDHITLRLEGTDSSTESLLKMGFIISGTDEDGVTYLINNDSSTWDSYSCSASDYSGTNFRCGEKTYTAGTTTAKDLQNPLWYAAKYGGFVDRNSDGKPQQAEWDKDLDGVPDTYYPVVNPLKLEHQFNRSFKDIISSSVSQVAPVMSVDESDRAQSGNDLYMAFFRPMDNVQWQGNLKKYKLAYLTRSECGRTTPEWTIVDSQIYTDASGYTHGRVAVDCDGTFLSESISYWSSGPDGGYVEKGGAGEHLLDMVPSVNAYSNPEGYYSQRNIYTADSNGLLIPFKNVTLTDLDVSSDITRSNILNYVYGYTYDSEDRSGISGFPVEKRSWVLGDIIHSEPKIIDYFDPSTGDLQYRFIAVGANDGMMHIFTDTAIVLDSKTYSPGDEVFAFIPRDLLPGLEEMATSLSHTYMVDGSPSLFRPGTKDTSSGYYYKTLVFGERRGGRSYWALDVTSPDPAAWKIKWNIIGGSPSANVVTDGTQEIPELGYTWSRPYFAQIKTGSDSYEDVVIFSGGYDKIEDKFPEEFSDSQVSGIRGVRDSDENYVVTVGGSEGYDKYNPGTDNYGRGIFVRKISDGSELFSVTYSPTADRLTGNKQASTKMKYCFPADISVIPLSDGRLLMYAADIYGQIWKLEYDYNSDSANPFESDLSTRWAVKRIFAANPGSSLAPGIGQGLVTPFTDTDPGTPGYDITDQGRKTFYSPDISLFGNEWTNKPVLYFGTGDRAHPRYSMISNRFYVVADMDSFTDETDLLNLTCDELDINSDADNDGEPDDAEDDDIVRSDLRSLLVDNTVDGFYRMMDKQGECRDGLSTDHTGEQILSQPTLFAGVIYFTSYQPVYGDLCNPTGNAFIYALDYSFGTAAIDYYRPDPDNINLRLEDSYYKISGSSIPSGLGIITRGGHVSGLISAGGKISGVAENQSTNIPEPPGGITRMLWDVK